MSATYYFGQGHARPNKPAEPTGGRGKRLLTPRRRVLFGSFDAVVLAAVFLGSVLARAESDTVVKARQQAATAYAEARALYRNSLTNTETAWQFGRASFDWAEFATNNAQRAEVSEAGIAACRQAVAGEPKSAPGHYYLAMNLGHLADTIRSPSAFKMVKEIEREFFAAHSLDEQFDHAGPDRNLGLLYEQAPVVISVGSRSKARRHLQRAVQLAPAYPENRLNLIEACLKWRDWNGARSELNALDVLWPAARTNFTGDAWTMSWADWKTRREKARRKIEQSARPIMSPKDKS